jgi:cell division protein FtsW
MIARLKALTASSLKGDPIIWAVVICLSLLSILVVYSATGSLAYRKTQGDTEYYLIRHGFLVLAGLAAMLVGHRIDYRHLPQYARLLLIASVPLLLIALRFGSKVNGASRWLMIPIINQGIQPSDIAKLALIVYLASILSKTQVSADSFKEKMWHILLPVVGICGLIALTNFSTAGMLLATSLLLMLIGRMPLKYLGYLAAGTTVVGIAAFSFGQRGATLVSRIVSFTSGTKIPPQAQMSYMAISNGGLFGVGPGNSYQKDFLPSSFADFIYSIIIEEYGLIGGGIVILLYLILLYRGMVTVARSQNPFGGLLSAGLSFSLAIQAMLNMAVAVGLVPITGQPLPLLSMGGTSLIFTGFSLGVILSVSRSISEPLPPMPTSNRLAGGNPKANTFRRSPTKNGI